MASEIDDEIEFIHTSLMGLWLLYESKQIDEDEYNREYDNLNKQVVILEQIRQTDLYKAVYNND